MIDRENQNIKNVESNLDSDLYKIGSLESEVDFNNILKDYPELTNIIKYDDHLSTKLI